MAVKIRIVVTPEWAWPQRFMNVHGEIFWVDKNVLYLVLGFDIIVLCICQNSSHCIRKTCLHFSAWKFYFNNN